MAPAFVVGLLVTAIHAPLGIEVLKRNIVFIDLAMAQVVGLALIALGMWIEEPPWLARQSASFGAGIVIALFFRWIERRAPAEQEAVIGSCFIVAASAALLALANDPHGGEELQHVLAGQILFVSWGDIASFLPLYGLVAALWIARPDLRSGTGFFVLFALAITASVQLVGVYVVFASLILPALAARRGTSFILRRALVSGAVAVIGATFVSAAADLPAGPFFVVCFAVTAAVTRLLFRAHASANGGRTGDERLSG